METVSGGDDRKGSGKPHSVRVVGTVQSPNRRDSGKRIHRIETRVRNGNRARLESGPGDAHPHVAQDAGRRAGRRPTAFLEFRLCERRCRRVGGRSRELERACAADARCCPQKSDPSVRDCGKARPFDTRVNEKRAQALFTGVHAHKFEPRIPASRLAVYK